jgi:hypothetical protein
MGKARRNRKRKSQGRNGRRIGTSIAALLLGGLSAAVLCRCLDDTEIAPLVRVVEPTVSPAEVDVGEGQEVDPTLLHERELLLSEVPTDTEDIVPLEEDEQEVDAGAPADGIDQQADLEADFPLHAVAYHFHTQIKSKPERGARVISYARRGAQLRVGERISTRGCRRGWHELSVGGFICDGDGVNVSRDPVTFAPAPPAADLSSDLPYEYKYAKEDNTPEYWRIPTEEEADEVDDLFDRIERRDRGERLRVEPEPIDRDALAAVLARAVEAVADAGVDPLDGGVVEPPAARETPDPPAETASTAADGGAEDPYALPPFVHLRMAKGYFVSTDGVVTEGDVKYQRTVRGRFIEADKLYPAKPSSLRGVLVDERNPLPLVFTVRGGVKLLDQEVDGGPLKVAGKLTRYEHRPFLGEIKRKGKRYVRVGKKQFVPKGAVTLVEAVPPPEDIRPGERWIDVNLTRQTLVAYEGEIPVFATLIATGREGFETPEGSFRIYGKHVSVTMDDPAAGEEAYSIEDVPWTQYFEEGYALHAAFWHDRFGRVRSHGCVNLSPADARRLFFWTGPHLPDDLHGIVATRDNPGTRVIVHK